MVWQSLIFAEKSSNVLLNAEDWSYTYGPLFEAIMMEKSLVFLLLTLIIVVAAFNIVSMLMTMINEKRGAIAILQTMGMGSNCLLYTSPSPRDMRRSRMPSSA